MDGHVHSIARIIHKDNLRIAECRCNAKKLLIEGTKTEWEESDE